MTRTIAIVLAVTALIVGVHSALQLAPGALLHFGVIEITSLALCLLPILVLRRGAAVADRVLLAGLILLATEALLDLALFRLFDLVSLLSIDTYEMRTLAADVAALVGPLLGVAGAAALLVGFARLCTRRPRLIEVGIGLALAMPGLGRAISEAIATPDLRVVAPSLAFFAADSVLFAALAALAVGALFGKKASPFRAFWIPAAIGFALLCASRILSFAMYRSPLEALLLVGSMLALLVAFYRLPAAEPAQA